MSRGAGGGSARRGDPGARLAGPLGASVLLHGALVAGVLLLRAPAPPVRPPMYTVNLVAAPPGPRAAGVVAPTRPAVKPAAVPPRAKTPPRAMPLPAKARAARPKSLPATPTPAPKSPPKRATAPAPAAGGGPTGGRGTDVATVSTQGVDFPFPAYLDNIVRQIAVRFQEPRNTVARAEVMFLVHRDGSVSDFRFLTRSGNFAFDLQAQGAVEQAGASRSFGQLPAGFKDDVLPVVFSFDPRVIQ